MTRPILDVSAGFDPLIIEKVERLLELLDAIADNPYLRPRLVLHGGTALNLFHADIPRLSVDIDLLYVGSQTAGGMLAERPLVDAELRTLAAKLGYVAGSLHDEHSGQSYRLRYDRDSIKVDVSYLARVPLLEPHLLTCSRCRPAVGFRTLQLPELLAGKVSALVDRTASRDLYDVAHLATVAGAPSLDGGLARAVVLHAVSMTDRFPFERDPARVTDRFAEPTDAQVQELRSVLAAADTVDFHELRLRVVSYLGPLSTLTPRSPSTWIFSERAGSMPPICCSTVGRTSRSVLASVPLSPGRSVTYGDFCDSEAGGFADDMVRLGLLYNENWSVSFDPALMLRTIPAVPLPEGAYQRRGARSAPASHPRGTCSGRDPARHAP